MQIANISSSAPTTPVLNPVLLGKPTAVPPLPAIARQPTAGTSAGAVPAGGSASETASSAGSAYAGASRSGGAAAIAAGNAVEQMLGTSYSTTVGGKTYSGSVDESAGEYTASIPHVQGATASGTSMELAEFNLDARIDEIV